MSMTVYALRLHHRDRTYEAVVAVGAATESAHANGGMFATKGSSACRGMRGRASDEWAAQ